MIKNKKISVIGQGFVGLPTTLLLSRLNNKIYGYDKNKKLINKLNSGNYIKNINEKEVLKLFKSNMRKRNLSFVSKLVSSDIYIICVPTPLKKNKSIDLKSIYDSLNEIIKILKNGDFLVIESTIAPGTIDNVKSYISRKLINLNKRNIKYSLAYCPERVLPGNTIREIVYNDRIIGGYDSLSSKFGKILYKKFTKGKIHVTDSKTAEIIKLSENAFRDTNIAFANEISMICDQQNIDYRKVINLANKHPRVNILKPGPGVGGHCIAVDPWFLISEYKNKNSIIRSSRAVNLSKTSYVTKKIIAEYNKYSKRSENKDILLMGMTYKPGISDIRESPSIDIVKSLLKKTKTNIYINDPYLDDLKISIKNKSARFVDIRTGMKKCSFLVFLVSHKQYENLRSISQNKYHVMDECGLFQNY